VSVKNIFFHHPAHCPPAYPELNWTSSSLAARLRVPARVASLQPPTSRATSLRRGSGYGGGGGGFRCSSRLLAQLLRSARPHGRRYVGARPRGVGGDRHLRGSPWALLVSRRPTAPARAAAPRAAGPAGRVRRRQGGGGNRQAEAARGGAGRRTRVPPLRANLKN
jgi:hypothetical protein